MNVGKIADVFIYSSDGTTLAKLLGKMVNGEFQIWWRRVTKLFIVESSLSASSSVTNLGWVDTIPLIANRISLTDTSDNLKPINTVPLKRLSNVFTSTLRNLAPIPVRYLERLTISKCIIKKDLVGILTVPITDLRILYSIVKDDLFASPVRYLENSYNISVLVKHNCQRIRAGTMQEAVLLSYISTALCQRISTPNANYHDVYGSLSFGSLICTPPLIELFGSALITDKIKAEATKCKTVPATRNNLVPCCSFATMRFTGKIYVTAKQVMQALKYAILDSCSGNYCEATNLYNTLKVAQLIKSAFSGLHRHYLMSRVSSARVYIRFYRDLGTKTYLTLTDYFGQMSSGIGVRIGRGTLATVLSTLPTVYAAFFVNSTLSSIATTSTTVAFDTHEYNEAAGTKLIALCSTSTIQYHSYTEVAASSKVVSITTASLTAQSILPDWIDPIEDGYDLYIQQAYEATEYDDVLEVM